MPVETQPLVSIEHLNVTFPLDDGLVRAVRDVTLTIPRGKTLGLVGESGCGKSMTGLALLGLVPPPGCIAEGRILYYGKENEAPIDLVTLPSGGDRIRAIRGGEIAMVFQEPMSSLTPVYTIGQQIIEMLRTHRELSMKEARAHAIEMLRKV